MNENVTTGLGKKVVAVFIATVFLLTTWAAVPLIDSKTGGNNSTVFAANTINSFSCVKSVKADPGSTKDQYLVTLKTSFAAKSASFVLSGNSYPMTKKTTDGKTWTYTFTKLTSGSREFTAKAKTSGGTTITKKYTITITRSINTASASPVTASTVEARTMAAYTNFKASSVTFQLNGSTTTYKMTGDTAGKNWSYKLASSTAGTRTMTITAKYSTSTYTKKVTFVTNPISITSLTVSPTSGTAIDTFNFSAETNFPAASATIQIDGDAAVYTMTNAASGRKWTYAYKSTKPMTQGTQTATVTAKATTGATTTKKVSFEIETIKITNISASLVPGTGGNVYEFVVSTNYPAASATLQFDNFATLYTMVNAGNGMKWRFSFPALPSGEYIVLITVKDAAGNTAIGFIKGTVNPTVYFDVNGGKALPASESKKKVISGALYGALPKAKRNGHSLIGWYTSKTKGTKIHASSIVTTLNDTILYAHWKANKYTIKFCDKNGKQVKNASGKKLKKKVTYGKKYGKLPKGKASGKKFLGWYTKKKGGKKITSKSIVKITKTTKLYAHWR